MFMSSMSTASTTTASPSTSSVRVSGTTSSSNSIGGATIGTHHSFTTTINTKSRNSSAFHPTTDHDTHSSSSIINNIHISGDFSDNNHNHNSNGDNSNNNNNTETMGGGHRLLGFKKRLSTLRPSPSITTISTIDTVSSSATLSSSVMGSALDSNSITRISMSLTEDQADSLHTTTIHSMSSQLSGYGSIASLDVDPYASLSGGNADFRAAAPDRQIYRLVCRANEQFHRKRYRPALSEYSKAIRLAMDANRLNGIQYSSANLNIHEKLAELTRQGGETADFVALLYANRSASYCMLNNYEEARADAEIAIRIRSDWGKGFYRKGEALLGLRQYEAALHCYEECLQRDPTNPDARTGMSNAKVKLEDQQSGLFTRQLLAGRDYAVAKSLRPIQNKIFEFAVAMRNFIYLIADHDTRDCVIVDACWDVPGLLDIIKQEDLNLVGAIVTHHHFDHVGGAPPPPFDQFRIRVSGLATILKKRPSVTAYVHPLDVPELVPANPGLPLSRIRPTPDGYVLKLGKRTTIQFLHTPGHTPGSQCLLVNGRRLFTGDTLFLGCCGRLDMPGGSPEAMWRSLRRLASLDDQLVIYPGHEYGGEWSTLQDEKMAGALKECTLAEWLKQQEERRRGHHHETIYEDKDSAHEGEQHISDKGDQNMSSSALSSPLAPMPAPITPRVSSSATAAVEEYSTSISNTSVTSFPSKPPPLVRIKRRNTDATKHEKPQLVAAYGLRPSASTLTPTTPTNTNSINSNNRLNPLEVSPLPSPSTLDISTPVSPSRPMSVPDAHALFNLQWQTMDVEEEDNTDDELPSEENMFAQSQLITSSSSRTMPSPSFYSSTMRSFDPYYDHDQEQQSRPVTIYSVVSPNRPSSASIKSFGLENDSYPSEDDSDLE